jgi:hypothetical protein
MQPGTEDLLKRELAALPELAPPPAAKARVLAAMRRAAVEPPRSRPWHIALPAAALAAAAATAAVLIIGQPRGGPEEGALATIEEPAPISFEEYAALVAQSAELERVLGTLPAPRAVMRAGTAGTIARLEDRIAQIDQELMFATAAGADSGQQATLWQDRVEVMNALLQVRYANSQAFIY